MTTARGVLVYNWSQAREFHLPCSRHVRACDWLERLWGSPCGSFEKEHHEGGKAWRVDATPERLRSALVIFALRGWLGDAAGWVVGWKCWTLVARGLV
jgi:hypothetical protein